MNIKTKLLLQTSDITSTVGKTSSKVDLGDLGFTGPLNIVLIAETDFLTGKKITLSVMKHKTNSSSDAGEDLSTLEVSAVGEHYISFNADPYYPYISISVASDDSITHKVTAMLIVEPRYS